MSANKCVAKNLCDQNLRMPLIVVMCGVKKPPSPNFTLYSSTPWCPIIVKMFFV